MRGWYAIRKAKRPPLGCPISRRYDVALYCDFLKVAVVSPLFARTYVAFGRWWGRKSHFEIGSCICLLRSILLGSSLFCRRLPLCEIESQLQRPGVVEIESQLHQDLPVLLGESGFSNIIYTR